jgi:diguanylate cyclase (GGDEF)-like protein
MISRLRRLIPFQTSALFFKEGQVLRAQSIEGDGARSFRSHEMAVGDGISGWVALSGKPMLNANADVEPLYRHRPDDPAPLRSALSIPLFDLQQQVFAVLTLYSSHEDTFSRDHLRLLQVMETKLALALQNALSFHRASSDAETDFLTSLPNARRLFLQLETELIHCRQNNGGLAVIVCDLRSFREVNDLHGHLAGNMLLTMIAALFRQSCRAHETVARMGGDEFVFLIPNPDEADLEARRRRITDDVQEALQNSGLGTRVTASLGVAVFPTDATTAEDLLALADRRMYLDKASPVPAPLPSRIDQAAV